jgi:hypothetical protein
MIKLFFLLFEGTFTSKIKSHKTVEIKVFFTFFLDDIRIRIRILESYNLTHPDRIHNTAQDLRKGKLFLCVCDQVKNAVGGKHNKRQQHSARQDLIEFTIKTETEEFEGDDHL